MPPRVGAAHKGAHNTSALLAKQLVPELELRVLLGELGDLLPCSVARRTADPLNEDLPVASIQSGTNGFGRSRKNPTILDWRQLNNLRRWRPFMLLQKQNMEDRVNTRTWG